MSAAETPVWFFPACFAESHGERDPVAHPSPFLLKEIISDDTVFLRLSHVPFIPVEGGEIALDAQPGARE